MLEKESTETVRTQIYITFHKFVISKGDIVHNSYFASNSSYAHT